MNLSADDRPASSSRRGSTTNLKAEQDRPTRRNSMLPALMHDQSRDPSPTNDSRISGSTRRFSKMTMAEKNQQTARGLSVLG